MYGTRELPVNTTPVAMNAGYNAGIVSPSAYGLQLPEINQF